MPPGYGTVNSYIHNYNYKSTTVRIQISMHTQYVIN